MRAEPRDAATDRLELRFAAAPEAEEDLRWVFAIRDLSSERGTVRRTEHAIRDACPPLDLADPLDVHAHVPESRDRHEEQVIAMRHAEAQAARLRRACERRLTVQAELDRYRGGRHRQQDTEHLAQP